MASLVLDLRCNALHAELNTRLDLCAQGTKEFGLCWVTQKGMAAIGTTLRIKQHQRYPDGRMSIDTTGASGPAAAVAAAWLHADFGPSMLRSCHCHCQHGHDEVLMRLSTITCIRPV